MVQIARYQELLDPLGLSSLAGVRAFRGQRVKDHKGRRDIFRIATRDASGREVILFLKRSWKPYKKDGLASLLRHGAVWSASRREWENCRLLQAAGVKTAPLVAYGEECGPLWEHFSFLITEAAEGSQTLESFQEQCRDGAIRRRVFSALAREVRRLHDAGYASPDLFTRHAFIDAGSKPPTFCWIDMARLDRERPLSAAKRARDLAALNITAPQRSTSTRERLRFLRDYCGDTDRGLLARIDRRMQHLLKRGKFGTWKAT